ncbi:polysaccharide pyruvyl transferase family protein [Prevotella sp. P2-180]|uniref:polysaccharide pyruvyl transferase family protein n=1 Tax=Prevotella sp. P2-180 TaxID=2024224 RepID=UPI000B960790|nr:polysaccharide pyruvyl transferase family protein [Prevotella sp. P2-180]OYP65156.1 hypothetical protein CIK98_09080 [Prevotella sp. P2-180]
MKLGLCLKYEQQNYGSKLQARATILLFEELGHECKVIHYGKAGLWFKLKALPRLFNRTFRQDKLVEWNIARSFKQHPEVSEELQLRRKTFKDYDKKYFDQYEVYGAKYVDIQRIAYDYEAIVTCSDQLWSPSGLGTNFYNLMFVPDSINKVSFASSFGVSQIPSFQKKATAKYLRRIEHVSCRENRGAEIVKELTGRDVPVLMDPVFAFNKEQWSNIIREEKVYDEAYLLCFLLGDTIAYREAVKAFAIQKDLKIVTLRFLDQYVEYDANFGDIAPYDADPNRLLNILRGAKYVITDSFHICAFSIIMHKQFAIFNRYSDSNGSSKNSRIDTVCGNLNLNDRRVNANSKLVDIMDRPIDWGKVDNALAEYAKKMREYLNQALKK